VSSRRCNALVALAGVVLLVASGLVARHGSVGSVERRLFLFVNHWPSGLYGPMFVFQQGGNLIIVIVLVVVLAAILRSWRVLAAGTGAVVAKLVLERVVKSVVERQRPGTTIGSEAILRGRVSAHGLSFVSGHVVLTVALATVLGPYLPRRWRLVPWLVVVLNAVARIYVGAHNPLDVVGGAGLGLLIGGVANLVVTPTAWGSGRRLSRRHGHRRSPAAVATSTVATFALLAGCSSGQPSSSSSAADVLHDDAITVASFDFPESELLAELYSQTLERAGLKVERAYDLGSREEVAPALVAGLVEVVPEYAGTALQFHSLGRVTGSSSPGETHAALDAVLRTRGLAALASAPAQDANTFVVTRDRAAQVGGVTPALSSLAASGSSLRLGGPPECPERPLCLPGLRDRYGITFKSFVRLDTGGVLTRQALTDGQVDVALLFSTDPSLTTGEFVELADDRGLQPAENITPVVHHEVIDRFGDAGAVRALDGVSARLTTEDVRAMNAALRAPGATVAAVVRNWRKAHGLG
jgi:osmoprotectant transport system substrate-binding protein